LTRVEASWTSPERSADANRVTAVLVELHEASRRQVGAS
jgi:hypothetical protein